VTQGFDETAVAAQAADVVARVFAAFSLPETLA
jgi:hypothetical protein